MFSRLRQVRGMTEGSGDLARDSTVSDRNIVNLSGGDRKLKSKMFVLLNHRFMK